MNECSSLRPSITIQLLGDLKNMGFNIDSIPWGVASSPGHEERQCVTRYQDTVIFLAELHDQGTFAAVEGLPEGIFAKPSLNAYAALPQSVHTAVRAQIQELLRKGALTPSCAVPYSQCELHLPVDIGDFTDFCCSKEHNLRAEQVIFGAPGLPPAFHCYPIGYTGRTSSIFVSGTQITRPIGMKRSKADPTAFEFGPSAAIDYEIEVGCIIGRPTVKGKRPSIAEASQHIFGFVLLNDWSARDIQALEMRPLGPLNGKSFGTSISPWVITPEALRSFAIPAPSFVQTPAPYLARETRSTPSVSLQLEVVSQGISTVLCRSQAEWMYWTFEDMITHQAINGCPLRTGDILATGTISGTGDDQHGCLMELTWGGKTPVKLKDGTERAYLQDGDAVRITGWSGEGDNAVSFGECFGELLPAVRWEGQMNGKANCA